MPIETNPFRRSMHERSQSPEDPFRTEGVRGNNPFRQDVAAPRAPPPSRLAPPRQPGAPPAGGQPFPSVQSPLDGSPAVSPAPVSPIMVSPPSYYESEGRRHSDPNLTRPDDEKSRLAMRDDSYREGYEEGMRIARERERQRRREYRERRMREREMRERELREHREHRSASGGSTGESHREHREHREHRSTSGGTVSERRSTESGRARSKSESVSRSGRSGRTSSSRSTPKNESLDVIDKLDATGLYGGSGFHHDGPFDACTPARNNGKSKRSGPAPIAAFPADGPNNSLAVEDPVLVQYRKDESVFGRDVFDLPPEASQASFDPTDRGQKVYGERTYGLGSSTFVDGTPASRDAILQQNRSGLGRQRSMLRRQPTSSGARRHDPDDDDENDAPKSLLSRVRSLRVGRH